MAGTYPVGHCFNNLLVIYFIKLSFNNILKNKTRQHTKKKGIGMCDKNNESGFTLVELIMILGILSVIAGVALFYFRMEGTEGRGVYQDLKSAQLSAQQFSSSTGCYPSSMAVMVNPNAATALTAGLGGCRIQDYLGTWQGPYLRGVQIDLNNGDQVLSDDLTGTGRVGYAEILTSTQNGSDFISPGAPQMLNRSGATQIAIQIGPIKGNVANRVCGECGGCVQEGQASPSTTYCYVDKLGGNRDNIGEVFATE
jgi:type II secretory pathway pseudopilin PulG